MPNATWYYARGGQRSGPVELGHLAGLLQTNQITYTDLVWTDGMADWSEVRNVPALMQSLASPGAAQAAAAMAPGVMNYFTPVQQPSVYAGFWYRVLASILDGLILMIPNLIIQYGLRLACGLPLIQQRSGSPFPAGTELMAFLLISATQWILGWLYAALQESSPKQATIGKRALNIRVTDEFGGQISFGRATGRHFGKWISSLTLLIGFMMAGWTEKKQALHDMLASTLVVRDPR